MRELPYHPDKVPQKTIRAKEKGSRHVQLNEKNSKLKMKQPSDSIILTPISNY